MHIKLIFGNLTVNQRYEPSTSLELQDVLDYLLYNFLIETLTDVETPVTIRA
jgi:hypothetical protein